MPGCDRTGPGGMGPITGGARGLCNPRGIRTGYRSYGAGFRGASPAWPYVGRGWGGMPRGWYPSASTAGAAYPSSRDELDYLKEQSRNMKRDMEDIERRIQELEKED